MALYTPFVERNVDKIFAAQQQAAQSKLAQSAYMGDSEAMGKLYGMNPQLAESIKQSKMREQQTQLAQQAQKRKATQEDQKVIGEIVKEAVKLPYEQAAQYAAQKAEAYGIDAPPLGREQYEQLKQVYGESNSAFSGTSMDAQVSNILSKGVDNAEFRNTPEYARAWQLANEPKVIRTPTGDILLRPELPPVFKAPGSPSGQEQISEINKKVKKDVEVIPGTEKDVQTTADEKLSYGYFNRMQKAEAEINQLGDFNPTDMVERAKGLSNLTASPQMQSYRQAADDWIRAKLRRESGAVIGEEEMAKEYEVYFPQIGDKKEVIEQKKRARREAEKAMKIAAGREVEKQKTAEPQRIQNDDDYNALPSGAEFIDPNGNLRRKP